jgi:hypothetical protein
MKTMLHKLLAVVVLATPVATQAQFDYVTNVDGNGVTITYYSGVGGAVNIPSRLNGVLVTGIGDGAFQACYGLTSVTIPTSVITIGDDAFAVCYSLTNVLIPEGVVIIGDYAFSSTRLTDVTIPASVTSIQGDPFSGCTSLAAISVAAQNPVYSGTNGVLFNEDQTTLIEAPGGLPGNFPIPGTVTNIDDYAFYYCTAVTNVAVPGSVTNIGVGVFESCSSLANVALPAGLTSIGDAAFFGSGLASIQIPENVTNIGVGAFQGCGSLTNATIPFSVACVESNTFYDCTSLASVTVAGSVTNIGESAFADCNKLTQVYFTGDAPAADGTVFLVTGSDRGLPTWGYVSTAYYLADTTGWADFAANTGIPAVLWNPSIQTGRANFGLQSNQFGFDITGTTNIPIVVEACTNLAQPVWVPLQSMTLTNGSVHFSEPFQTNTPARFYRIAAP